MGNIVWKSLRLNLRSMTLRANCDTITAFPPYYDSPIPATPFSAVNFVRGWEGTLPYIPKTGDKKTATGITPL